MREIMIGVDSSDAAAHATRRAGQLAKETGATLTVVHVHYLPSLGHPRSSAWRTCRRDGRRRTGW
jgi:nucleotide-binding universal stress UspA family protein